MSSSVFAICCKGSGGFPLVGIARYNMVSRFLVATGIEVDEWGRGRLGDPKLDRLRTTGNPKSSSKSQSLWPLN